MNWNLLLSILHLKGNFLDHWIGWIRAYISYVSYSVLLNEKPKDVIQAVRGIRQGDPLSPFLFVLAMDYFSNIMEEAQNKNLIQGFTIPNKSIHISNLLFVDGIILFFVADDTKIQNLFFVIKAFEQASELNINMSKSNFTGVNIDPSAIRNIEMMLGCCHSSLPISYLGMPLGGNPKAIDF